MTAELFVEVLGCLANLYIPEFDFQGLVRKHDLLTFLAQYAQPGAVDDDILLEVVMFVGVLCNEGTAATIVRSGLVSAPGRRGLLYGALQAAAWLGSACWQRCGQQRHAPLQQWCGGKGQDWMARCSMHALNGARMGTCSFCFCSRLRVYCLVPTASFCLLPHPHRSTRCSR